MAERLYWSARKINAAGLRARHPHWPEELVGAEVRRIFLDART
jgi:predicted ABC-type transport system involved in lysophospholipase L1 biosynthesis ATPase subunit